MKVSQKDLKVRALVLAPILLFLFVWVVFCGIALADDSMISMDKGVIVLFLVLGFFVMKDLFINLINIRKIYLLNKARL